MKKVYWLTKIIEHPQETNTFIADGVQIIEKVNVKGQITDVVGGFDRFSKVGKLNRKVVLMTYINNYTERKLLEHGLIPLGGRKSNLKNHVNLFNDKDKELLNNIDESFPNLPEGD
jgi:hypothetical protein